MDNDQHDDDRAHASRGEYEVGYGKPPREHQWKKGAPSPNPGGRRKRPVRYPELVARIFSEIVTIRQANGSLQEMPYSEALLRVISIDALKGDHRSRNTMLKMMPEASAVAEREPTVREITEDETATLTPEERVLVDEIRTELRSYLDTSEYELDDEEEDLDLTEAEYYARYGNRLPRLRRKR